MYEIGPIHDKRKIVIEVYTPPVDLNLFCAIGAHDLRTAIRIVNMVVWTDAVSQMISDYL